MTSPKKLMLMVALGMKLLVGFEAEAMAHEKEQPKIASLSKNIKAKGKSLHLITKSTLADKFINVGEFAQLEKGFNELFALLKRLKSESSSKETRKEVKHKLTRLQLLFAEFKKVYQEDQAMLESVPELNKSNWWGKEGIYKTTYKGKKALAFVVFSHARPGYRSIGRTLVKNKLNRVIRSYLGSAGWAKKPMLTTKFKTEDTKVWAVVSVPIEK